ncbi:FeoB-associated Cys-rich membrane protein [Eubacteriaceae bacterium ES3]|nr:FeoB-associated Cys-rich membrane protein [Eubacteriaceae bacterium ES3]
MATFLIAAVIIGSAAYILVRKFVKMKNGDFSCEGCKGGACSSCSAGDKKKH